MPQKTILLQPVQQEDFTTIYGGRKETGHPVDPLEIYAPSIAHFEKFAIGSYFWFVADTTLGIAVAAGGQLEKMLPLSLDAIVNKPPDMLFRHIHPEDIEQMFTFTNHWITFFYSLSAERKLLVRPTIYIRLQNLEGAYNWAMVQYAQPIIDSNGALVYSLTLVTDISHIKTDGVAMMSIVDSFDHSCQHFICNKEQKISPTHITLPKITPRETDILRLLAVGYSSKRMADELNLSVKTIDNHRQNLLAKTGSKNSSELTKLSIKLGLV